MNKYLLVVLALVITSMCCQAQNSRTLKNIDVSNTKAVFLGKTDRIDKMLEEQSTRLGKQAKKQSKNLPQTFLAGETAKSSFMN